MCLSLSLSQLPTPQDSALAQNMQPDLFPELSEVPKEARRKGQIPTSPPCLSE